MVKSVNYFVVGSNWLQTRWGTENQKKDQHNINCMCGDLKKVLLSLVYHVPVLTWKPCMGHASTNKKILSSLPLCKNPQHLLEFSAKGRMDISFWDETPHLVSCSHVKTWNNPQYISIFTNPFFMLFKISWLQRFILPRNKSTWWQASRQELLLQQCCWTGLRWNYASWYKDYRTDLH